MTIGFFDEGLNVEIAQYVFDAFGQSSRVALCCAIAKFAGDNDARADVGSADFVDPSSDAAATIVDDVGDGISIEQPKRHRSSRSNGSGGRSAMSGKRSSSASGSHVSSSANSLSRDFLGFGSMISLPSSLRIRPRCPAARNREECAQPGCGHCGTGGRGVPHPWRPASICLGIGQGRKAVGESQG